MKLKILFLSTCLSLIIAPIVGQNINKTDKRLLQLIPEPQQVIELNDNMVIKSHKMKVNAQNFENELKYFENYLEKQYNFKITNTNHAKSVLTIKVDTTLTSQNEEAYKLRISKDSITIVGKSKTGVFRGLQTLIQLFPFEKKIITHFSLPCLEIMDEPRFSYRGAMLDVSRHFFPISFVKKFIDWLAWYKFDYFHWHLTDDQGWRIEIKAFPKLQTIAAYRDSTLVGYYGSNKYDGKRYGGYYTQEEIKDVVKYAADRYITIIPEIEMPGHSIEALAAYPELGCTGGPYHTATGWGGFDDVFCAGNEQTYDFLEKVLSEVFALFPSHYVHIGGDECSKVRWKVCPKCQAKIKEEHLKNEEELQSYLIKRIEKYATSKDKEIIGWDEILEGGVNKDAIVMSWRGEDGGIQAAKMGNKVIMSPETYWYLDHSQTSDEDSLVFGGAYLPLEKMYSYTVVPESLTPQEAKYIIGGQANTWTEYMNNTAKIEYMVFPRLAAVAECLWTDLTHKDYSKFIKKVEQQIAIYNAENTNYSKALFAINYNINKKNDTLFLNMNTIQNKSKFSVYINNNPIPIIKYGKFFPLPITSFGKYNIILTDEHNKQIDALNFNFINNKAFAKNILWIRQANSTYPGHGKYGLNNGLLAKNTKTSDREWMGFKGNAIFYLDLGSIQNITNIKVHAYEDTLRWIYAPKDMLIETSTDGNIFDFKPLEIASEERGDFSKGDWLQLHVNTQARYLKVTIQNIGNIPSDRRGAGNPAWLFVDEVMVE